jgi:hypothetical protein
MKILQLRPFTGLTEWQKKTVWSRVRCVRKSLTKWPCFTYVLPKKKNPLQSVDLQWVTGKCCDPVGIRTPNLRIRSAMLYPVELQSQLALKRGAKIARQLVSPNLHSDFLRQNVARMKLSTGGTTQVSVKAPCHKGSA